MPTPRSVTARKSHHKAHQNRENMSDKPVKTQTDLLEHIQRDWSALNTLLESFTDDEWITLKNTDGWTIKDHVAHLTVWEQSVIAFLTSTPRHSGLQISEDLYYSEDIDAMNDAIFKNHQHDSLDEVRQRFQITHRQVVNLISPLSDADLALPYVHYLPNEVGVDDGPPAINVIYGNTAHHYRQHHGWIQAYRPT